MLIFTILLIKSGSLLLADGDTGYHIQTGRFILQHRTIPDHDIFSYLTPAPQWIAHEWLSEVIMALIYQSAGLTGLVIFFALFLALTHVFLYQSLRSGCNDLLLVILVTATAIATSSTHWFARPHVFSLALTLAWYHLLNEYQYRNRKTLRYLPALMVFWANLHGGFVMGLLLLGVYAMGNLLGSTAGSPSLAGERLHKAKVLWILAILCAGAACLNPRGYEVLLFPFKLTANDFLMDRVAEFLSPNFHKPLPFKYMLLMVIAAAAFSRARFDIIEVGVVLLLTHMSLYSVRYVSLFAVLVSRPLLRASSDLINQLPSRFVNLYRRRGQNLAALEPATNHYLWPASALIVTVTLATIGVIHFEFSRTRFPIAAVEFLKREPVTGNIFNHDEFGDYMIFAAWPQYRVFIDGRSDMYGADRVSEYLKVADGQPDWETVIRKYNISVVFFDPRAPISAILRARNDWSIIYSDSVASIFVRSGSQYQPLSGGYHNFASSNY